jgi:benzoyl-CoA reductase/2-hydroxyglutaryl-CoA dehydratase subunit BcrC/BadD/HgdB
MLKFCDPEEFDYPIFKKELEAAKIPALYLEIEQQMDSVEPLRTRIQSFTEMLGNGRG